MNHIIQREIRRKGGRIFGFFVDFKSAFDKVDRKILWEAMERRGVRKGIVERVKEIYESIMNVVKVDGRILERFWTEKGVRQDCPLSPILFSLLMADIEEEMKRG